MIKFIESHRRKMNDDGMTRFFVTVFKMMFMVFIILVSVNSVRSTTYLGAKADIAKPTMTDISQKIETFRVSSGGKDDKANLSKTSINSFALAYGENKEVIEIDDTTLEYTVDGKDDGSYVIHAQVDESTANETPFSRTTPVISYNSGTQDFENKPTFILFKITDKLVDFISGSVLIENTQEKHLLVNTD